jgi:hypothetical protein
MGHQQHQIPGQIDNGKDLPLKMSEELKNMLKGIIPQSQEKEYPVAAEETPVE